MTPSLHFHFLTLFPPVIETWMTSSILGRALEAGLFTLNVHQLRDFTEDKHRIVDDAAYGGGGGMVLKIEPLARAVESLRAQHPTADWKVVAFTPAGRRLDQPLLDQLRAEPSGEKRYLLVCGHYEGIDQRFLDHWVDLEVSLGDFVITGGELPALVFADALVRLQDGALGDPDGNETESFRLVDPRSGARLLEYPHYTRPAEFRGHRVPDVLLSGNHPAIADWRAEEALRRTRERRPDLLNAGAGRTEPR